MLLLRNYTDNPRCYLAFQTNLELSKEICKIHLLVLGLKMQKSLYIVTSKKLHSIIIYLAMWYEQVGFELEGCPCRKLHKPFNNLGLQLQGDFTQYQTKAHPASLTTGFRRLQHIDSNEKCFLIPPSWSGARNSFQKVIKRLEHSVCCLPSVSP